jgi:hypothetical protein
MATTIQHSRRGRSSQNTVTSVADPAPFDTDPDPDFHFDTDPDLADWLIWIRIFTVLKR